MVRISVNRTARLEIEPKCKFYGFRTLRLVGLGFMKFLHVCVFHGHMRATVAEECQGYAHTHVLAHRLLTFLALGLYTHTHTHMHTTTNTDPCAHASVHEHEHDQPCAHASLHDHEAQERPEEAGRGQEMPRRSPEEASSGQGRPGGPIKAQKSKLRPSRPS